MTLGLALACCLALSFLFSGIEAGFFALSRVRIRTHLRAGRRDAELLHGFLEDPENFLWTILVGNTVSSVLAFFLAADLLHQGLGSYPLGFWAAFAAFVFVFFVLGDLLPKMLFRQYPNRLCLFLVRPFRFIHLALRPLVALVEIVTAGLLRWTGGKAYRGHLFGSRAEFRQLMQESAQSFTSAERQMIGRVLDLQNYTVKQITIPLRQAVTVHLQTRMAEALSLAREQSRTRLLVRDTPDAGGRIVGVCNLKSVLYDADPPLDRPVAHYVHSPFYLFEETPLEVALREMRTRRQRLAVVVDRERREIGIISIQDILSLIFGEVTV